MTPPDNLPTLLESASGADRELDALIAVAVNAGSVPGARKEMSDDPAVRRQGYVRHYFDGAKSLQESRRYTASLDAAMTLVPKGFGWRLWMPAEDSSERPRITIWGPGRTYAPHDTEAATPALALCSASLRAREAGEGQETQADRDQHPPTPRATEGFHGD